MGQEHIEVVLGSDPLEEALSDAIFLVRVESSRLVNVVDALVEADIGRPNFKFRSVVSLVIIVVLGLGLVVQGFSHVQDPRPGTEELIIRHVSWLVKHCVLIVLQVELKLFRVVLTALKFRGTVHFYQK